MPRDITSHKAHVAYYDSAKADFANEWREGASPKPNIWGAASAVRGVPRRVLGVVPVHRLVVDRLDGRRYADQQKRLRRLGLVAAVNGTSLGERKRDLARRDRVLSIFRESGVFEQGRVVGIQPIIYATAHREHSGSLTRRAKTLSNSIDAEKVGGETLFNPKPLVVGSRQIETTEALYEAATDLEQKAQALNGEADDTYVPSPILIIVMGAGHIARTMQGPSYDEVVRSGIVTLDSVDTLPKGNVWTPRFMPLPAERPTDESEQTVPLVPVPANEPTILATQPYTSVYS
jgi:hypothetical protein